VVMGLDPSVEMLRIARSHGLLCVVVGAVPGLPVPGSTFDRVIASFVLAHFSAYEAALLDMVRVLRPGGRLGMTAWGASGNKYRERWQSIAESFAGKEALHLAIQEALPWEDWFAEVDHVQGGFRRCRLD